MAEHFHGRLSAVGLSLRHVEIVHVDVELLARGRTVDSLAALVHLGVQEILGLVGTGVRRECQCERDYVATHHASLHLGSTHQVLIDVDRLTRTSSTHHQCVLVIRQKQVEDVGVTDRVIRGDDNLRKGQFRVDLELVDDLHPLHPLLRIGQEQIVIHHTGLGKRVLELVREELLTQESIKLVASIFVGGRADTPDERKDEQWLDAGDQIGHHHVRGRGTALHRIVRLQVAIQNTHEGLGEVIVHRGHELLQVGAQIGDTRLHVEVEVVRQLALHDLRRDRRHALEPALHEHVQAETLGLHVNDTHTRHRRRRGHGQVLHLEHHRHL